MKECKRGFTLITVLLISLALLACSNKQTKETNEIKEEGTAQETQISNTPEEETEQNKDETITSEVEEETEDIVMKEIRDISSFELIKEIKIGWNLGNTMDATGGQGIGSEISWGNPITKKAMIDTVKEAGFNILRIPTTWENHMGPAPDYVIDKKWIDRVEEIVDFGIENDMFVILNMHHEDWHFPSYDNLDAAKEILTKGWTQIAERFKGYDEHLIFEGLNEPRKKGTNLEWNGGDAEGRDVVNQLNATFIETIRNSGGNNPLRHLMIPNYAASSDPKVWKDFVIPEDDKIIVSVHSYAPYNFALNTKGTAEWSIDNDNDKREINSLMNNIDSFYLSKKIPVIIGEFGAMNKDNLEARVVWAEYFIKTAREKDIPCIWWDNGAFKGDGELFGLLDRRGLTWQYPEVVEALMKGLE